MQPENDALVDELRSFKLIRKTYDGEAWTVKPGVDQMIASGEVRVTYWEESGNAGSTTVL